MTNFFIGTITDNNTVIGGFMKLDKNKIANFNKIFIKDNNLDMNMTLIDYGITNIEEIELGAKDKRVKNLIGYIIYDSNLKTIAICGEEGDEIFDPDIFYDIKLDNNNVVSYITGIDNIYDCVLNSFLRLLKNDKISGKPIYFMGTTNEW